MIFSVVLLSLLVVSVHSQSTTRVLAALNGLCSTNPESPTAPYCEGGLICVDESQIATFGQCNSGSTSCTCQSMWRDEGYTTCTSGGCSNGQCCSAGLYCTQATQTCVKESKKGDTCENDNQCVRGFFCNKVPDPTATTGKCEPAFSVKEQGQANNPFLCQWGLVRFDGSVEICVKPDTFQCTATQSSTSCGNQNPTSGGSRNPFSYWYYSYFTGAVADTTPLRYGYTCNPTTTRCEVSVKSCSKYMKEIITKDSGKQRNQNGLKVWTNYDHETCEMARCIAGGLKLDAKDYEIPCSSVAASGGSGSSSSSSASSAQIGGAVAGTAGACALIGALAYWKGGAIMDKLQNRA